MAEAKQQTWTPIKEAVDDFWTAFLTPPIGHLSSFTSVVMKHDQRFPPNFLADFLSEFNRLHGWNLEVDPDYEIPIDMMKQFYNYEKEKIKKKEREQRQKKKKKKKKEEEEMKEVQPLVTAKEVAQNIEMMKKKNQNSKDERSKYNKKVLKSHKFGREVDKFGAYVVNQTNRK